MSALDPSAQSAPKVVDVAVGVIERPDGQVLLAQRPSGRPYEGYWEFPGGKVEPGEPVASALARELNEELGLTAVRSVPWLVVGHTYPHATVRLYFRRVFDWQGEPQPREGQQLSWQPAAHIDLQPLLPASMGPIRWLALPRVHTVSCAGLMGGAQAFLQRLDARLDDAQRASSQAAQGPSAPLWLQLREPDLPAAQLEPLFEQLMLRRARHGLRLIVSSRHPLDWAQRADGVHLTSRDLLAAHARPQANWVGASCHDARELAAAAALGCDYALMSPVLPTASHLGAATLGFDGLSALTAHTSLPVYALGGLTAGHLAEAQAAGAQGVALMRAAWG